MKKIISIIVLVFALNSGLESQEYPINLEKAHQYFMEAKVLSEKDNSRLWGVKFYDPMMFVDLKTRFIITNKADLQENLKQDGNVFVGYLKPEDAIANTAVKWAGETWMMIMWAAMSNDILKRTNLMMHELYHCIQTKIGLPTQACDNKHLDQMKARIWIKMEWNALEKAIFSRGKERKQSIKNAIEFRSYRHSIYPEAQENEIKLEMNEGIAEYTGFKLSLLKKKDQLNYFKTSIPERKNVKSYVRSFAYVSGPLYGYLLDEKSDDWRSGLTQNSDLGVLLANLYEIHNNCDDEETIIAQAQKYDYTNVFNFESQREKQRLLKLKVLEDKFINNSVLKLNLKNIGIAFDPRTLQPFKNYGTVYQTIRVTDDWGILEVKNEALMSADWSMITVSTEGILIEGELIKGDGWTLQLKEGWKIENDGNDKMVVR